MISAFNTLSDSIASKLSYDKDSNTKGPLLGDSTALSLRSAMYSTIQGKAIGITGSFDQLADVGVTIGSGGKLTLNRDRLRAALEQDPQGVADLFAARVLAPTGPTVIPGTNGATYLNPDAPVQYISQGVATQLENFADSLINSVSGTLTRRNNSLNDQIASQNQRIAAMDDRLAVRRQILQAQFLRMEQAIGQLQQQQGSISQIGG